MHARNALKTWLSEQPEDVLAALLEQRRLPQAAGYVPVTSDDRLAEHLLTDMSVAYGLDELNVGGLQLLDAMAEFALEAHGPVPPPPFSAYLGAEPPATVMDPYDRLLPAAETVDRLARAGGTSRERIRAALDGLAQRALLLPAPEGHLALPPALHMQAAELAGYGRPADTLLSRAFNAAEIRQIAAVHGAEDPEPRTRQDAQRHICRMLGEPDIVRDLVASAPQAARDLLAHLVPGPPVMLTHCFVQQHGGGYGGSKAKHVFRAGGSGDEGTDWLAAHGMVVPVGEDLVELPYEVGRALRGDARPELHLDPEPPTRTASLPRGWAGQGAVAAGAAAWRAELVLRELAARPVGLRKAGGVTVRDTRRLAKAAGAREAHASLWLDLAANAGLVAPQADQAEKPRGGRPRRGRQAPARLLPTDRYDEWAAAVPAAKLLPLITAWAVVPEVFTHWPDGDDTPVALISPQDPLAVPLRHGVLCALATLPDGRGVGTDENARTELLARAAWFQPVLNTQHQEDEEATYEGERGGEYGDARSPLPFTPGLHRQLQATLAEAELLGLVAHGALTAAGCAVTRLLDAGAARHHPAVPGAHADPSVTGPDGGGLGDDLAGHPALRDALAGLRAALHATLPAPSTTARFQADSTATVTGAPAPELAELLSAVGDIESEGHAVVWRITPASLRRAYDAGWDAEEVHARLTEVADGTGLPQPLAYTIKDTARAHGRLRVVRTGCCVRSDDTTLVTEVARARGLAKLKLRRIAPTVLVSTASEEETLAALRAAGYAPALEAETGTTVVERAPAERVTARPPALDEPHTPYGAPGREGPATARELARSLATGR